MVSPSVVEKRGHSVTLPERIASGASLRALPSRAAARLFSPVAVIVALTAANVWSFNSAKIFDFVILPFIVLGLVGQKIAPLTQSPIESNELKTDIISLIVTVILTACENALVHRYYQALARHGLNWSGWLPSAFRLEQLHFWLEALAAFLIYDFLFYVTHRIAHSWSFFWRLHAMHHSPNKVTYMNSNRVHPLDTIFRRFMPAVVLLLLGVSREAFVLVGVLVSILGPITHFNIRLKHGALNYVIGTNEVHVWHHSADPHEARNFGLTMIWDHLFGTFYFPRDRALPARMGLAQSSDIPIHDYWRQLWLGWRR